MARLRERRELGYRCLLIEVHPDPLAARSDGPQQLKPKRFAALMAALKPVAEAVGRTL